MDSPLIFGILQGLLVKGVPVWIKMSGRAGHREGSLVSISPMTGTVSAHPHDLEEGAWYEIQFSALDGVNGSTAVSNDTLEHHSRLTQTEVGWLLTC